MDFRKITVLTVLIFLILLAVVLVYKNNKPAVKAPSPVIYTPAPAANPPKTEKNIPKPNIVLPTKKIWGAYTGNTAESLVDFQKQIGGKVNINAVFPDWGSPFPVDLAAPLKDNGQTIIIFWEPSSVTLDQIISGSSDYYISSFAMQAKAYGAPVILIPFEEMNGNWDSWDGTVGDNTPAKIILAWRHMHDLFAGVTNVKFGWDVNSDSVPDMPSNAIENYYPGADYVDYVGVDGFNFGNPWQTYSDIFSSAIQELKTFNKPIYIFSMACAEGPEKASWISDALSQIKSDPSIAGWIWFNENKEQNWLVWSDQSALGAFQAGIK